MSGNTAEPRMTDTEYQITQQQLLLMAELITTLDLDGFLRRINEAETLGPIFDPTLYMRSAAPLDEIKQMARGAAAFKRAVLEARMSQLERKAQTAER